MLRQLWLNSTESYLKCPRKGQTDTDMGASLPRFPALGRRKYTFDAFLRQRYTRAAPARFRRVHGSKYIRFRPVMNTSFIRRSSRGESKLSIRRSQRQLQKASVSQYLPTRNRALRKLSKKRLYSSAAKRRFATLPLKLAYHVSRRAHLYKRNKIVHPAASAAIALMRTALRRRYVSRRIRDLRKAGRRRRITRARKRGFWEQYKLQRRAQRAARYSQYRLSGSPRHSRVRMFQWAFSEFAVCVRRKIKPRASHDTSTGELLGNSLRFERRQYLRKLRVVRSRMKLRR